MSDAKPPGTFRNLLRFYGFALKYWRWILVALVTMSFYSTLMASTVLLLRPFEAAFRAQEAREAGIEPADVERARAEAADARGAPSHDFLQSMKEQATAWVMQLAPVRAASDWLLDEPSLRKLAFIIAAIVGPLFLVFGFFTEYAPGRVAWGVLADVRVAVFSRLCGLSLGYFGRQRTGELVSRLTNDLNYTRVSLKIMFGKILMQPMMLLTCMVMALWSSPHLTLVSVVFLPVLALVIARFGPRIRRHATKTLERLADITQSLVQMLSGVRVVKAFNMEEAEEDLFRERNRAQVIRAYKLVSTEAWASVLPMFVLLVVATSISWLVADYLLRRSMLGLDDMLSCGVFLTLASGRVRRIVKAYNDLQRSSAGISRVLELLDTEPDIDDAPDAVELTGIADGIRFEGVRFSYDSEPVLQGIDLTVPKGMTYAVVGQTGAGKSTMLDLIPRFYDVQEGAVRIDDHDVREVTRESLMRQIAIVSQHPFLFNRPIHENIRYGKPDATDEEVYDAARAANIHDFITGLPHGYDTVAGETGDRLSGGQRQCITIARALLKNAPILILDEATSSLDAESEMLVQQALQRLMQDRTTIVIAHRLSTVRNADRIVVLKGGRIAEQGTHDELLAKGGEYGRLYRLQFASLPPDESNAPSPVTPDPTEETES